MVPGARGSKADVSLTLLANPLAAISFGLVRHTIRGFHDLLEDLSRVLRSFISSPSVSEGPAFAPRAQDPEAIVIQPPATAL